MAGYSGYSMSNNAVYAYLDGEKPYSKWNREELIDGIRYINLEIGDKIDEMRCTSEFLKSKFLVYSSWHHTSKLYNRTDFYKIDEDLLEDYTIDELEKDYQHFQFYKKHERELKKINKWIACIIDNGYNKIGKVEFELVSCDNFNMIVKNKATNEQIEIEKSALFYHNYQQPYNQFLINLGLMKGSEKQ